MFAGSCIGVILLVMSLELLRRASREYDTYILRQFEKSHQVALSQIDNPSSSLNSSSDTNESAAKTLTTCAPIKFRPNLLQQVVRATLHMVQFTIAYFVMLLAMYYNGYIIISIVIGAWLGAFVFSWEGINMG
jgi:copper transporter 1